jgi:uncharacterized protein DUF4340
MATRKSNASRASRRSAPSINRPDRGTSLPRPAASAKPVLRAGTWVTILILAVLVGIAVLVNKQKAQRSAETTPTPAAGSIPVFDAAEGLPDDIKIESAIGQSVEVARNAAGAWVLKSPAETAADQASAQAAAAQVQALHIVLGSIDLGLNILGLDKPAYTITIAFTNGKSHTLSVGAVTPIQTGYYTQLDGGKPQVIDKEGLDALLGLLANPPYAATPTSIASPTPTPAEATATAPITETPTRSP